MGIDWKHVVYTRRGLNLVSASRMMYPPVLRVLKHLAATPTSSFLAFFFWTGCSSKCGKECLLAWRLTSSRDLFGQRYLSGTWSLDCDSERFPFMVSCWRGGALVVDPIEDLLTTFRTLLTEEGCAKEVLRLFFSLFLRTARAPLTAWKTGILNFTFRNS